MWLVPLKIVSNVSRFKPALNLNRVLADLNRGSNSLNSISGWFQCRIRLNIESCSHQNPECANSYNEIRQTGLMNSTLWKIRCSFNPKAQVVNKVQRQLRPEPYFHEIFKSRALVEITKKGSTRN